MLHLRQFLSCWCSLGVCVVPDLVSHVMICYFYIKNNLRLDAIFSSANS